MTVADLSGKVAIVTGSGQGLGRAYARALAAAGADLVINDVNSESAEETVRLISGAGGQAVAELAAVGPSATAPALVDRAVEEFGRLDILVTNAGVLRDRVLWKMTDEDFDQVIETHLRGTFTCARAAAIRMKEQAEGGRIIVIGSPAGQFGNFGQTNYAAAKAGIVTFARVWSMELARDRITANAVVPTAWTQMTQTIPIYAPLADGAAEGAEFPAEVRRDHAIGWPEECAPLVVFLASDEAADITGQAIGIGGDRLTLYAHSGELTHALHDGGWDAASIAAEWRASFAELRQPSGVVLPPLDLEPAAQS